MTNSDPNNLCSLLDCGNLHKGHGYCEKHLQRFKKHGDPSYGDDKPKTVEDRILAKIEKRENCWYWLGHKGKYGHGQIKVDRKQTLVYRITYEIYVGPIPNGLVLDHFMYPELGCIGPSCCNPEHVKPVTLIENTMRSTISMSAINKNKTHCIRGHEFSEENTKYSRKGQRRCVICHAMRAKKSRENRRNKC